MISTVTLAILTWKYVRLTKIISETNVKYFIEATRPYVTANIFVIDQHIKLVIKNTGNRCASNVMISFNPKLEFLLYKNFIEKFNFDLDQLLHQATIVPQHSIDISLNLSPSYFKNSPSRKLIETQIEYDDGNGKKYKEKYEFDTDNILYEKKVATYTDQYFLNKISEHTNKVNELIKELTSVIKESLHSPNA